MNGGRMDGETDRPSNGGTVGPEGPTDRRKDCRMEGLRVGGTDGRTDGRMKRSGDGLMERRSIGGREGGWEGGIDYGRSGRRAGRGCVGGRANGRTDAVTDNTFNCLV